MNDPKDKNDLDITRKNIPKTPKTPEEAQQMAAEAMANFYSTVGNCCLNIVAISNDIAKTIRNDVSVDFNDIAFYLKKIAIKMDAVTELDIAEHEKEEEDPPPANSTSP